MNAILMKLMLLIVLIVFTAGCEKETKSSHFDDITHELRETLQDAKKTIKGYSPVSKKAQSIAAKEIEKLYTLEYKVEEVPKSLNIKELEKKLVKLGQKRWECFHVESTDTSRLFFCKRRPKSYLRYIPRFF